MNTDTNYELLDDCVALETKYHLRCVTAFRNSHCSLKREMNRKENSYLHFIKSKAFVESIIFDGEHRETQKCNTISSNF